MNHSQYKIENVPPGSADALKVKLMLHQVADKTGLIDQTATSRLPNTMAYYTEPGVANFRTDLGARFYGGDLLIDVVAGFGPTPQKYIQVNKLVGSIVTDQFGKKVSRPSPLVPIPFAPEPTGDQIAR